MGISYPQSSSSSRWYRFRFQFSDTVRLKLGLPSGTTVELLPGFGGECSDGADAGIVADFDSLAGAAILIDGEMAIVLSLLVVSFPEEADVSLRWLEVCLPLPLFFGNEGPMAISSSQCGLVLNGLGWRYRPGFSASSLSFSCLSRRARAFALLLARAPVQGVHAMT